LARSSPLDPFRDKAAALLAGLFGEMEAGFFPHVVVDLSLTQRATLARAWDKFRRRVSTKI
jgi:hypothetical protein